MYIAGLVLITTVNGRQDEDLFYNIYILQSFTYKYTISIQYML